MFSWRNNLGLDRATPYFPGEISRQNSLALALALAMLADSGKNGHLFSRCRRRPT